MFDDASSCLRTATFGRIRRGPTRRRLRRSWVVRRRTPSSSCDGAAGISGVDCSTSPLLFRDLELQEYNVCPDRVEIVAAFDLSVVSPAQTTTAQARVRGVRLERDDDQLIGNGWNRTRLRTCTIGRNTDRSPAIHRLPLSKHCDKPDFQLLRSIRRRRKICVTLVAALNSSSIGLCRVLIASSRVFRQDS